MILTLTISCVEQKDNNQNESEPEIEIKEESFVKKDLFQNSFKVDTSLTEKMALDYLTVTNSKRTDSIVSICNCDKDQKNNSIKIQLQSGIPTKKDLNKLSDDSDRNWNTILQTRDIGYLEKFSGQFKFLNITLKDSSVRSINIYSKSTDKEYNGSDFDSLSIEKYKISISKFDYSIASDIYGEFEIRLEKGFGLFENDTILKGNFQCNNWIIWNSEKIKSWDINKKSQNYIE